MAHRVWAALLGLCVSSVSSAPLTDRIDLEGYRHLDAVGITAEEYMKLKSSTADSNTRRNTLFEHTYPGQKAVNLPDVSGHAEQAEEWLAGAVRVPANGTCQDIPPQMILACNISCQVCTDQNGARSSATCSASGKSATVQGDSNATLTVAKAMGELFLTFDLSPNSADCGCSYTNLDVTEKRGCKAHVGLCIYFYPAGQFTHLLSRAKVWDLTDAQYKASSLGWQDPSEGFVPDVNPAAAANALVNLRTENPNRPCNPPQPPPMVIIPGLTSSSINYKLTNSPPPSWAFYCNRSTDGFLPLWPLAQDIATHPFELVCWVADFSVEFDPDAKTFKPVREGITTEVVDFGGFGGIPAFQGQSFSFQVCGWTIGKDLFAAPFDWRVPSSGQDEFFSSLQNLVEQIFNTFRKKVVLWAWSFGPQYTLSFLHRMTQSWKDQYLHWFVGSSPVFSGAPVALLAYVSGFMGSAAAPKLPAQCKAYTAYQGTCYTGKPLAILQVDLDGCCEYASKQGGDVHMINYFEDNSTCFYFNNYESTEACSSGILAYWTPNNTIGKVDLFESPGANTNPFASPALTRNMARGSPALMWTFPRAGSNATISWTKSDPIIVTPSKNYTAFDVDELLHDMGINDVAIAQHQFLEDEEDLGTFAPPGVNMIETYGYGLNSSSSLIFDKDFDGKSDLTSNISTSEDGDGLVPKRSSLRADTWRSEDLKHELVIKGYENQQHAYCFPGIITGFPEVAVECGYDVLDTILGN